ncbi:MAG: hypothetical protein LQ343_000384 [Gyalolechia ehrenbergii]|nr:MAG: hypothetical protein LQ343_000384 [Gyalolechia ehrenbergii]
MTTRLLEMNPEYYTIWNYRRLLLRYFFTQGSKLEPHRDPNSEIIRQHIADDLAFLLPLLRKFPKCYWIWNYRLWLLDEASRLLPTAAAYQLWQQELALVGKMLSLDSRNFHGWGYRSRVVEEVEKLSLKVDSSKSSMTESEFNYTTKMIESNLSNFSAWHRRSKLIPRLLDERRASHVGRKDFLDEGQSRQSNLFDHLTPFTELELIQRALWADPDSKDQSLWFYHQYLISNFEAVPNANAFVQDLSVDDKAEYVKTQIGDLQEMLEGAETCKWIYQRLLDLSLMGKELIGQWPVESSFVESWIDKVTELDPLRKGRWHDLQLQLAH